MNKDLLYIPGKGWIDLKTGFKQHIPKPKMIWQGINNKKVKVKFKLF
jgi:hypothetical protein